MGKSALVTLAVRSRSWASTNKDPSARLAGLRVGRMTWQRWRSRDSAGVHTQLAAVEMATVASVVWRRKERELGVDAVRGEVVTLCSDVEVDPIAKLERSSGRRRCYQYACDHA